MSVTWGVDTLCRFCRGTGKNRHDEPCLSCAGTGIGSQKAVARRSDPETSKDAANSLSPERLRTSQALVLDTLRVFGPATDETLFERLPLSWMSPSGARTRRAELCAKGLVVDSGKRETLSSGRRATLWAAR